MSVHTSPRSDMAPGLPYDRRRLEDIGYMTCMTLTLLGNYAQTGHFGGPLAYTPFNVAAHLAGPELGGLRYDYRRPKHPYGDKFMLAAGHCAPTCYALWMILGQALYRKHHATGRSPLSRGAGRRDAAGRRAGIPPRRRRAEDLARGPGAVGPSAVRPGEGARHPGAVRTHRVHRSHQRRQRRPLGRRSRDGRGKGGVLGHHRRPHGDAEGHRARGRVRHDRGTRPGAQDPGHRAAGRQAAPDLPVRQQRGHRRFPDRRRCGQQVLPATAWSTSGLRTAGTCSRCRMVTTTTRSWARSGPWRPGIRRIAVR